MWAPSVRFSLAHGSFSDCTRGYQTCLLAGSHAPEKAWLSSKFLAVQPRTHGYIMSAWAPGRDLSWSGRLASTGTTADPSAALGMTFRERRPKLESLWDGKLTSCPATRPSSERRLFRLYRPFGTWLSICFRRKCPAERQKFSIIQTLLSLVIPAMASSRPFGAGIP